MDYYNVCALMAIFITMVVFFYVLFLIRKEHNRTLLYKICYYDDKRSLATYKGGLTFNEALSMLETLAMHNADDEFFIEKDEL